MRQLSTSLKINNTYIYKVYLNNKMHNLIAIFDVYILYARHSKSKSDMCITMNYADSVSAL